MVSDDLEPITVQPDRKNLEILSIEALHEYIRELQMEITRAESAISDKESARESADSFFKT
ncbi:MAG: DUF1192 domain-containing protein [Rhodospirillaceae bacterium]|nr:DUF1192 domain-containing protein [Rhodospirillaceae bacterium]